MGKIASSLPLLVLTPLLTFAVPSIPQKNGNEIDSPALQERALSPYAPVAAACPSAPLVRPASISSDEAAYVSARKTQASAALSSFLAKTNPSFGTPSSYPTVALATSGGGFRSLLTGAGVHQALDSADSTSTVAGLYQSMTYELGLSGGGWLLGSLSGNNWPTITSLRTGLWENTFQNGLVTPEGALAPAALAAITADILAKSAAGFSPTVTDIYGRMLGYALLYGADGGVADNLSGVTSLSSFTSHSVPFPIFTSIGVDTNQGQCVPPSGATQYETSPYSFGSWDPGVQAFAQTRYLGSTTGKCFTGYDNQGYVMGTTSNVFNEVCAAATGELATVVQQLEAILAKDHVPTTRDLFAAYPNPFQNNTASTEVAGQKEIDLADGGETGQNDPIWPSLYRTVDFLYIADSSSDTSDNYPNGTAIHQTYVRAQARGLSRMPVIPDPSVFVSQGFSQKPKFFGCNDNNVMTIAYVPNTNYTFDSGQDTFRLQYSKSDTDAMIANGNLVGSNNGDAMWATCLGCAIMKKSGASLPAACQSCFTSYCYN